MIRRLQRGRVEGRRQHHQKQHGAAAQRLECHRWQPPCHQVPYDCTQGQPSGLCRMLAAMTAWLRLCCCTASRRPCVLSLPAHCARLSLHEKRSLTSNARNRSRRAVWEPVVCCMAPTMPQAAATAAELTFLCVEQWDATCTHLIVDATAAHVSGAAACAIAAERPIVCAEWCAKYRLLSMLHAKSIVSAASQRNVHHYVDFRCGQT